MSNLRIKSETKSVTPDTAFHFNSKDYLSTCVSMGHHYYYIINRHVLQSKIRLRKGGRALVPLQRTTHAGEKDDDGTATAG
jgi:hypothetical protein